MSDPITAQQILERVRRDGLSRTVTALRKPPVPSRVMQELVEIEGADSAEARLFVAAYPLAPGQLLETILQAGCDAATQRQLAGNPRTPPHLLSQLAASEDAGVRLELARHPKLPPRELLTLARDADPAVRAVLATNSALRLPDQAQLADDDDASVRLALAGHAALSPQAALVLAADSSAVVRVNTAAGAHADEEIMQGWAAGDEEELHLALLRREDLSPRVLRLLLLSPHPAVRVQARERRAPDAAELYHLCTKGEPAERAWVAAVKDLPRALQSLLARDADPSVRCALAANPALVPEVARWFTGLAEADTCEALAGNPAVSGDLIHELAATRLPAVLRALAYRRDLGPELVRTLVSLSPAFRRHWALNGGTVTGLEADVARTLLADPLPRVRALAVAGHAWRRADLYDIARDPAPVVRLAALAHANVPEELLVDWCKDPDPEVAAFSQRRLAELRAQREALRAYAADLTAGSAARRQTQPSPVSAPAAASSSPAPVAQRHAGLVVDDEIPGSRPAEALSKPAFPAPQAEDPSLINKLKRILFWQ